MAKLDGALVAGGERAKIAASARLEIRAQLRGETSASNAQILGGIRDIVRLQINQLTAASVRGETFDSKQSISLLRLAQTYAILDSATRREHAKYDLTGQSASELEAAETEARRLLGTE